MGVRSYVITRAANRLATLIALMIFSFFIFEIIPQAVGIQLPFLFAGVSPQQVKNSLPQVVQATIRAYDLNGPLWARLGHFLLNMFTLNYGNSAYFKKPVVDVISQYLPNTLVLGIAALATTSAISLVAGVVAGRSFIKSKRKTTDKAVSLTSIGLFFLPAIWISIILYVYFADQLHLFPINLADALNCLGTCHPTGVAYYARYLWAAFLPIVVVTIVGFGHRQQLIRNNLIEEYTSSSYSIYARARGLPDRMIFYKHALRNAMLPWLTQTGIDVAFLISGIFFVEYIFNFTGLGYASTIAAQNLDMPFLIATTFIFGAYILIVLFVLDLLYARVDPRIRLGE